MTPEQYKQLISAYIDNELTPEEAALAQQLIATRAECKAYYDQMTKISSMIKSSAQNLLSPDATMNILKNVNKEKPMKPNSMKIASAVMAVVLVVGLTVTLTQRSLQSRVRNASVYMANPSQVGIQGKMKSSSDDIRDQYSPGNTNIRKQDSTSDQVVRYEAVEERRVLSQHAQKAVSRQALMVSTDQYAPYYQQSNYSSADQSVNYVPSEYNAAPYPIIQPLSHLKTYQPNTEEYATIKDNEFLNVTDNPLSTMSIDVDTASYSNIRRYLNQHQMPPIDAVRIEEMINYFTYNYPKPKEGEPFSVTTQMATCPWNNKHQLLHIGLKGKTPDVSSLPASNLTFLIDVSGSMSDPDKLPLLKEGYSMMVNQLRAQDKVSIVVYAGNAGLVLEPTTGDQRQTILNAINSLNAGGSTAGGEGIRLAYETAKKNLVAGGNNRVIWATDGDFNVGISNTADLTRFIEEKRKEGIFLTVLGFGQGNYKDNRMESIADHGNGNYYYIDNIKEARKVLVNELGSTLYTIAKDVKVQIEFNPKFIGAYRLIGYENRVLAKEDFNNDQKDAGEIGAGHTVTALYEIVPAENNEAVAGTDPLKYQKVSAVESHEMLTLKLRYKEPNSDTSKLISQSLADSDIRANLDGDFAWAAAVAEFGLLLRQSPHKANADYAHVLSVAKANKGDDKMGLRQEFIDLVEAAASVAPSQGLQYK